VKTNAHLPLDTYASVTPAGLKQDETFIGNDQSITLRQPTTTFAIDLVQDGKALPAGKYVASVESVDKADLSAPPQFAAHRDIVIPGPASESVNLRHRNSLQRWVLGEMDLMRPWSDAELRSKLGRFERYESPNAVNSIVYYFPEADVSLFVDPSRQKVFAAKLGRVP
jgi:hypothetical protein